MRKGRDFLDTEVELETDTAVTFGEGRGDTILIAEQSRTPEHDQDQEGLAHAGSQVDQLSEILQALSTELHPERTGRIRVHRDSSLERDLGIDSLGRVELLLRLERAFGVQLSEEALMTAETAADLLAALRSAGPDTSEKPHWAPDGAPASAAAAEQADTLLDVLAFHKDTHGDRAHVRLIGAKSDVWTMTYRELWQGAQEIAAGLRVFDLPQGSAVAIMLPTGEDFFQVFFGVLFAGCVPLPIYPPIRRAQIEEHLRRQAAILKNAQVPVLVTTPETSLFGELIRA